VSLIENATMERGPQGTTKEPPQVPGRTRQASGGIGGSPTMLASYSTLLSSAARSLASASDEALCRACLN
jgi:hypothetical protein